MTHLFVPYQESLELKKLGFSVPCFCGYNDSKTLLFYYPNECFYGYCDLQSYKDFQDLEDIAAPLYSQVFDWFREKHGYIHTICRVYNWNKEIPEYEGFCIYIGYKDPKVELKCNDHFISNFYQDYREAELIVLQTLIEIVKNDNTTRS